MQRIQSLGIIALIALGTAIIPWTFEARGFQVDVSVTYVPLLGIAGLAVLAIFIEGDFPRKK